MSLKVAVCMLAVVAVAYTQLIGGYAPIPDMNTTAVQTAIEAAKTQLLSSNANVCPTGLTVVHGEQQVVNGMNYKFQFRSNPTNCGQNGSPITCESKVYVSRDNPVPENKGTTCQ